MELIKPGHRVILDSGTTTYEIARLMRQHSDVIAMTNGMNVANALLEADGVELLMTGGHLRRQSQSFYGDQAEQSLQNYHFDMLFLGVDAIDLERGVSTHNEDEARLNRRMCEVAERIIVVIKLHDEVHDGDRVEIYRPLIADPKELRRQRAEKSAAK